MPLNLANFGYNKPRMTVRTKGEHLEDEIPKKSHLPPAFGPNCFATHQEELEAKFGTASFEKLLENDIRRNCTVTAHQVHRERHKEELQAKKKFIREELEAKFGTASFEKVLHSILLARRAKRAGP
ncbi:MAG: hypothetical protein MGU50_24855 [Trichodesmium sp. MAG_R02]|nr:hypothetical protein [Trichodesmium sp. MAG_R02]